MTSNKKIFLAVTVILGVSAAALVVTIYIVLRSGITRPIDNTFGDQHLKTTVALVELHKTRFGEYPERLTDLRFLGDWDKIHLSAVDYCTNSDNTAYFVDVRRGWAAKPDLEIPSEFWAGTGFDKSIGPCE